MSGAVKTAKLPEAFADLSLPALSRNLFSAQEWATVICRTYRIKLYVKYIERDGQIVSYVFYSVVKNFLEWKICILSYCDYCDCHVASVEDWQEIIAALKREFPHYRIAVRNLRDDLVRRIPELKVASQERYHILDVRGDIKDIWKKAHDSFKAAVNQGERGGVVVRRCGIEDLPKFYALHLQVRKNKYRVFPQPYSFFRIIWQEYMAKGKGVLLGAFDPRGKFIAGNIYLECGNTLYYKFNTSSISDLSFRPNNFLFWEGVKYAKERGLEFVDLGSSGLAQQGLIRFKDHTGAKMLDITHLGYAPPDYRFSQKRILRWMTSLFTQPWMPNFMVRIGSHIIYPFLA